MTSTVRIVHIGKGATLALRLGPQQEWQGIGEITVQGTAVRDGTHPMVVRLDTPDGYLYTGYRLQKVVRRKGGAVEVHFRAFGCPWGRQEYEDEYDQPLFNLSLGTTPVEDLLVLKLGPVELELGGRSWTGFSYSFAYRSKSRQIHRLLVNGSWELGGSLTGHTVLSQGQCNMPVYHGLKQTLFTTACLKALHLYGSPQGVSFQLAPRGGLLQAFDFQHGKRGALLQYWPNFGSISSLLESPAGSTRLQVADEYRFPLAHHAETTPQHVLFTPGPLAEHEARDLWWEAYQCIYGGIRRRYGVVESVARPKMQLRYSTRMKKDTLMMTVSGKEVPHHQVLYAIADRVLPQVAKMGIRRFWARGFTESDISQMGLMRKLDTGLDGGLHCSSVCATHRVLPAEFWGGLKGWKYMADRAHELGLEIGPWFPAHFSPRAAIFKQHPEWLLIGPNSNTYGGGYGFSSIVSVDWNTGVTDWIVADVKRWQAEAGLDYIWVDSFSNLGLLMPNYAAGMRNNLDSLGRLYGELSRIGIKAIYFESVSPFGLMGCGMADLCGDKREQDRSVAGQNDFGWWVGEEDMLFNVSLLNLMTPRRSEEELRSLQFRAMANRGYLELDSLITGDYQLPGWWVTLNQAYEQALPHMKLRRLLPHGAGVCWLDGDTRILWAYQDLEFPLPAGARVDEFLGPKTRPVNLTGALNARGGGIYRIRG